MKKINSFIKEIRAFVMFLSLYFVFLPFDFIQVLNRISVLRLFLFIPLVLSLLSINKFKFKFNFYNVVPLIFLNYHLLNYFISIDKNSSWVRIATLILNIVVILYFSNFEYSLNELKLLEYSLAFGGLLLTFLLLFNSNVEYLYGRATLILFGHYQDPNELVGYLIFSSIFYLRSYLRSNKLKYLIIYLTIIYSAVLTGSRGGMISLVISTAIYFYSTLLVRKNETFKIKYLLSIMILFVVIMVFKNKFNTLFPPEIIKRFEINLFKETGSGRTLIWKKILTEIKNAPILNNILGYGSGSVNIFTNGKVGHNIYLESFLEIGLIGLVIYITFLISYIIWSFKNNFINYSISLLGYMILGLSLSLYSYKPIWTILLLINIVNQNKRKKKDLC